MSFRPIIGIPRLTQDWGTEQHERETHWTSLFYDLMVVAALNAIAEPFEERMEEEEEERFLHEEKEEAASGGGPFVLTPIHDLWLNALLQFVSVVNPWNQLNEFTSMFEDESFIGHISFFVHAFGLAATTAGCVGELRDNYKVLATGIVLAKLGLLVLYSRPILFVERAKRHMILRSMTHCVNIALVAIGMQYSYEKFRIFLVLATLWDWFALLFIFALSREDRIPIHIQSYSDRIKEVTMVIFGEAIFAIILQPYQGAQSGQTHFYLALAATLWMIYAMALQEFHILPSVDDHALRRSVFFACAWYYTQFFKQFCLLGASIGLKRAHLLTFKAPLQPIDDDTRRLIVWGLSMTLLNTMLIRSYSFGFGRHPSREDPPDLYWLKVSWWTAMGVGVLAPQILDRLVLQPFDSRPLVVLIVFGCLMSLVIVFEAAMSNLVAAKLREAMEARGLAAGGGGPDELTYLHHCATDSNIYTNSDDDDEAKGEETEKNKEAGTQQQQQRRRRRPSQNHQPQQQEKKCSFPVAHCPKHPS